MAVFFFQFVFCFQDKDRGAKPTVTAPTKDNNSVREPRDMGQDGPRQPDEEEKQKTKQRENKHTAHFECGITSATEKQQRHVATVNL
jgi:hypothetical protein